MSENGFRQENNICLTQVGPNIQQQQSTQQNSSEKFKTERQVRGPPRKGPLRGRNLKKKRKKKTRHNPHPPPFENQYNFHEFQRVKILNVGENLSQSDL